tara:strand:- start:1277 stop:2380 length:1104 start_codon:yes stop_codon:yes gene_type:complete
LNKKLKIAIIGSRGYPYIYSGYETLVKELSERLVKKGHIVRVYCHCNLFEKKPKNVNGIELIYTPSIKSKVLSQLYNSFFSFLHVCFSDNDVVLVVNSANGPYGILTKLFKKKTCINVDGLEWLRPKWKGLGSLYFLFSSWLSTIFFDKIITDSFEMKKIYLSKFKKNSSVISYGSTMLRTNFNSILFKYNLKKNQYYLIVGRLIPDNNSLLILNGFIKSKSNKKLVIVGDVPYKDYYSNNIKSLASKKIIFTGYIKSQNALSSLYQNSFAYIHGHEYGGTNPTMINALDLNCEIIALKTKFNIEMLEGKESIFFEKNEFSVSESLNIFEKSHKNLRKKNIKYKLPKNYTWFHISNQYINHFKSLME